MEKQKKKNRKWIWITLLAVIAALAAAFLIYVEQYYHADADAKKALASDKTVQVEATDYGWFFDGPGKEDALVFYPGAKVEETAYAPMLHRLAEEGLDVCLVKMPFRLAIFAVNKADRVMGEYEYEHWFVGGHSLGGAMAASYAADHGAELDGVILFAAYASEMLDEDLMAVVLYGSEDKVLNRETYQENLENLPEDTTEHVIRGGNHAQFGSYGFQEGDGEAKITPEEQVEETADVIAEALFG